MKGLYIPGALVFAFCICTAAAEEVVVEGAKTYRVQRGDTLTLIARYHYGKDRGLYYPLILAANPGITDPDDLPRLTELVIPDLQRNLRTDGGREAFREALRKIADFYREKGNFYHRWDLLALANAI